MKHLKQTQKRIVIKTIIYRILGLIITFLGGLLFTNNLKSAFMVTILIEVIQMIVYFSYEQLWNKIQWGFYSD